MSEQEHPIGMRVVNALWPELFPGDKGQIDTAWGRKSREGLAASIEELTASPDLLAACKDAAELCQLARRYFPKSIKNSDTFHLLNVEANSIRAAIAKVEGHC